MQSSTYRRVFVLGSGFSKSFLPSMPTLRDLNSLIPEGIPDEFPHFKEYCRRFLQLCNGEREYLNIESLATSILSARIFPGERERLYHSSLRFEMLRFIASAIRRDDPVTGDSARILSKFLKNCAIIRLWMNAIHFCLRSITIRLWNALLQTNLTLRKIFL